MILPRPQSLLHLVTLTASLGLACTGDDAASTSATTTEGSTAGTTGATVSTSAATTTTTTTATTTTGGTMTNGETSTTGTTDPGMPTASDPTTTDATTTNPTTGNTVTTDPAECTDGMEQCKDGEHQVCEAGKWVPTPCSDGEYCDEQSESCAPCVCAPGALGNCINDNQIESCNDQCSAFEPVDCVDQVCIVDQCVDLLCVPDQPSCEDQDTYKLCNGTGTGYLPPVDCGAGEVCEGGACISACEAAALKKSNIGCEFWAVDMDNLPPRDVYTYAVAISNPSFSAPVNVQIFDRNKNNLEQMIVSGSIPPRQVKVFNLSGSHNGFTSYYNGQDAGFLDDGIALGRAFRVKTDLPVLATQFNPIGGALGYTTDASLLLPTHTLGKDYLHMAWTNGYGNGSAMDIVATEDNTTVTITPKVNTQAGKNGLPAMTANVPTAIKINRYDYIQLMAGTNGPDLSGSKISATAPVAVFGGHSCANVPTTNIGACDHVEEQILPLETWGKNYVAVRNPPRPANNPEVMVWRIIAAEDNTTVNFDPPVSIGAMTTLNAGQMVQFEDKQSFSVTANDPILVVGYMIGCTGTSIYPGECDGDPYMVQMVANEQFLKDYVFLIDSSYTKDFAQLIRPTGAAVTVGCLGGVVPENRWTKVGNSGYDVATIDMNPGEATCKPGTNEASSPSGFGIVVSGRAYAASYAYPGGLALQVINPQ